MLAAYITGWRVPSELLTRKWREHVDLLNGWLRLEPGETKSGQGRMFPFVPILRELVERQIESALAIERETGREVPWSFHKQGQRIVSFYRAWHSACASAGGRRTDPSRLPPDSLSQPYPCGYSKTDRNDPGRA
jgi:integrase